jgi:hypothetical protein
MPRLLRRVIPYNSVISENPGHSAPHGLTLPRTPDHGIPSRWRAVKRARRRFLRFRERREYHGSAGVVKITALLSIDLTRLSIFRDLCYIFIAEELFIGYFCQISGKNTFLSPLPCRCLANFCSPPVRASNCIGNVSSNPVFLKRTPQHPRVSSFSHSRACNRIVVRR